MYRHSITREYDFSYGHRLWDNEKTDEGNNAIYGKCCTQHGHNAKVFVTIEGPLEDGMVMNFNALDLVIKPLIEELDHKNLNDLPAFQDKVPTAEHMAEYLFDRIKPSMKNLKLYLKKVKVYENDRSCATYQE